MGTYNSTMEKSLLGKNPRGQQTSPSQKFSVVMNIQEVKDEL